MSPSERIVAWLDEAHGFGSLENYVKSLVDQPPSAYPINRLPHEAVASVRATMRGKPADEVAQAVRQQARETLLRFELVIGLNVAAQEQVERQGLVWAALLGQLGILELRQEYELETVPRALQDLVRLRNLFAWQVDELLAGRAARVEIEARYLDGRQALFPAIAAAWVKQLSDIQETTLMVDRLTELDGAPSVMLHDPSQVAIRTATIVREHVAKAKVTTLEKLDDEHQLFAIANRWLRELLAETAAAHSPGQ
jgi:hypothetical protein